MKKIFLLSAISLAILTSCTKETSDNVNQDKIWTEYQLIYNDNTHITSVKAIFKFSNALGTLLELKSPAYVLFNSDTLNYNPVGGWYEKEYTTFVNSGTFKYKDLDNNVFTNSVVLADTIGFPTSGLDTIVKSVPLQITWLGSPVKAKETISAWVNSNVTGDSRLKSTSTIGNTSLIFGTNDLAQLGVGPYGTILMERLYSSDQVNGTSAGGVINLKYIPKNRTSIVVIP
ncbi:MAG: hypothetical protein M9916_04790 [Crocinitomicaceae bacterium]|nr:hypothetical protein [Crocinitomicaceae bacterium]